MAKERKVHYAEICTFVVVCGLSRIDPSMNLDISPTKNKVTCQTCKRILAGKGKKK